MRIAIVEDNAETAHTLKGYVERYFTENGGEYQLTVFSDGADIIEDYKPRWDLIFMDIEMPLLDGMSTAARIRRVDSAVVLVFITNMAQYAIKGYEVDAMDFVLKPVKYPQFVLKLKKAQSIAAKRARRYLLLSREEEDIRVPTDDVTYIEVIGHRIYVHTVNEVFSLRGALADMEKELEGLPFARSSNSYLVNLAAVRSVKKDSLVLVDGEVPMSRSRKKEVLEALGAYMGGGFR